MDKFFEEAFRRTMTNEGLGELSNDPQDPGGMTYSGISREYWEDWGGWSIIDESLSNKQEIPHDRLLPLVKEFYYKNFWLAVAGDKLSTVCPEVSYEMFDTAVNMNEKRAITFLQAAFNLSRGTHLEDLKVDGSLGPKTLKAVSEYMKIGGSRKVNEEILLNCMNGEQYIFYKENPKHKYFRGWFRRV